MNVLFVCKYNRFRSKIAEYVFNKNNLNRKIKARGAGVIAGYYPLDNVEVKAAEELGFELKGRPQELTRELIKWADKVVIVADDVPSWIFEDNKNFKGKLERWNVPDLHNHSKERAKEIILEIEKKVRDFIKTLDS